MSRIVQKFGGTSVATLERIQNVANIISFSKRKGIDIAVVVSAMAGVTNNFVEYANSLNAYEGDPEYDSLVSSGEIVTASLLAIALKNNGINAKSYTAWQVPILTDSCFGQASIERIETSSLEKDMNSNIVPIICGFQGVSGSGRITTLGRGGSDLTAVALTSALKADMCEIYSDVDGIYTTDPNLFSSARKLDQINSNDMLDLAIMGAKVMQGQSIACAIQNNVKIRVASSFIESSGTIISQEYQSDRFCGIAVIPKFAQISIIPRDDNPDEAIKILNENFVHVFSSKKTNTWKIIIDRNRANYAINILKRNKNIVSVKQDIIHSKHANLCLVGGNSPNEYAIEISKLLSKENIEVLSMSHSYNRINFMISRDKLIHAISLLHQHCRL